MESLLEECADLKFKCADGSIIQANKYTMLSMCPVIRQVYEDTRPKDSTFPLIGIPPAWTRIAVDLLHDLKKPSELSLQEAEDAQDAFQFFDCKMMRHALSHRVWHFLSKFETQADLVPYIRRIMNDSGNLEIKIKFMKKFRSLGPRWVSVREIIRNTDLTLESASFFMTRFVSVYPSSVVFREIFERLPLHTRTAQSAMMLMSRRVGGTFSHPGELETIMNCVVRYSTSDQGHEHEFVKCVLDTMSDYEDAPPRKIVGTTIQYEYTSRISAHTNVAKKGGRNWTARIAPWLSLTKTGNALNGTLDLRKVPAACESRNCQVHVTAVSERRDASTQKFETVVVDVWRRFDGIVDHTLDLGEYDASDPAEKEFVDIIASHGLRHIHVNAFFGIQDAMNSSSI
jgi:hypothetical protein